MFRVLEAVVDRAVISGRVDLKHASRVGVRVLRRRVKWPEQRFNKNGDANSSLLCLSGYGGDVAERGAAVHRLHGTASS